MFIGCLAYLGEANGETTSALTSAIASVQPPAKRRFEYGEEKEINEKGGTNEYFAEFGKMGLLGAGYIPYTFGFSATWGIEMLI